MIQIPEDIKNLIASVPVSLATSSLSGFPNCNVVSDIRVISDSEIIIADNFFNKTRKNLDENRFVALVVHSTDYKQTYQLKGMAQVFTDDLHRQKLFELFGADPQWPKKSAVIVTITEIWDLRSHQQVVSI